MTDRPSMISCRTVIGFGLPTKAGTQKAHSDAPGEDEIAGARKLLNWTAPPFEIPEALLQAWRAIGAKGRETRMGWDDDTISILEVAERLQDVGIAALTLHARTRCQMYRGHAD